MNAMDYIKKYGEAAYNMLPDEFKKQMGGGQQSSDGYGNQPNYGGYGQDQPQSPYSDGYGPARSDYSPRRSSGGSPFSRPSDGGRYELAEEERILKTYHASHLRFPKCEGYLTVTNKRVIFRGEGGGSFMENFLLDEIKIDTVSGLSSFMGGRINWMLLLIGVIAVISGAGMLSARNSFFGNTGRAVMTLIVGVIFLIMSYKKIFMLKIYSGQATGSPIEIGEGLSGGGGGLLGSLGSSSAYSVVGRPTEDTLSMLKELGAIIRDMQTLDEETVFKKWA